MTTAPAAQPRRRLIRWASAPLRALRFLNSELLAAGEAIARANRFPPPGLPQSPPQPAVAQPAPAGKTLTRA